MSELPDTNWYKVLLMAAEVVKKAVPHELIDPKFIDATLTAFGHAFRAIPDLPNGWKSINPKNFAIIKRIIGECAADPFNMDMGYGYGPIPMRFDLNKAMKDGLIKMSGCPLRVSNSRRTR